MSSLRPHVPLSTQRPMLTRRQRKRPAAPVFGGKEGTYESVHPDFACPVCCKCMDEPFMTQCGHSFCHGCIQRSLEINNKCPRCNVPLDGSTETFPNFALMELIQKYKNDEAKNLIDTSMSSRWQDWGLGEVNSAVMLLNERKKHLEGGKKIAEITILKEFLEEVQTRKEQEMTQVKMQLENLSQDIKAVTTSLQEHQQKQNTSIDHEVPSSFTSLDNIFGSSGDNLESSMATVAGVGSNTASSSNAEPFAIGPSSKPNEFDNVRKKRKVSQHFEDLEKVYINTRTRNALDSDPGGLKQFADCLSKFTEYTAIRALASLNYTHEVFTNSSSIVSSIEFDRDCEYFAIAGVTKKIKVFEYPIVRNSIVDLHYPVTEMNCNSKISCVAWNPYRKYMLSSADYDGTVCIWDSSTNQRSQMFEEHEKRCWSIDFNKVDPKLLASGSDDTKVKIWDWDRPHSVMTIDGGANVCCVKFNPTSRYNLAFGSADHCVHYYDLRNHKKELSVFKGHSKAVSYVKFLSSTDLVSASTDSQLKLWTLDRPNAISTFKGHINEKNFVGLATNGDYIACGSENNSLYLYYKGLPKQILTYKFEPSRRLLDKHGKEEESSEFVSAVTWKPDDNVLVAANSQGLVKLLELV